MLNFPQLQPVYPSTLPTVFPVCINKDDPFQGANEYVILLCEGYYSGQVQYSPDRIEHIHFVHRIPDTDSYKRGVQHEQLIIMLIDRLQKLNAVFPDPCNVIAIEKLKDALSALEERVRNRAARGVLGEHKL